MKTKEKVIIILMVAVLIGILVPLVGEAHREAQFHYKTPAPVATEETY